MPENKKDAGGGEPPTSERNQSSRIKSVTAPSERVFKNEKEMEMEKISRHLSKHVFPREYGLPNVFLSENLWEKFTFQVRESHIEVQSKFHPLCVC
jgi:hypothetical protein